MTISSASHVSLHISGQEGQEDSCWSFSGNTTISIGRSFSNDVILPYTWVSRRHAMLQVGEDNCCSLIDLGSSNGTFVNQQHLHGLTILKSGDIITMGSTTLVFQQESEAGELVNDETQELDDQTVIFLQKETVSVLVCDIRSYTALSEDIGDSRISDLLTMWSKVVSGAVHDNGGRVDKFIGDAVMAVWGEEDGAQQVNGALRAAAEIQYLTGAIGKRMKGIERTLEVWVSLNTGQAILGNLGVSNNRDYTIVGDVVNVAFRLEEIASGLKRDIVIGERSYNSLKNGSNFFTPYTVNIRGKSEPLKCYGCNFEELYQLIASG